MRMNNENFKLYSELQEQARKHNLELKPVFENEIEPDKPPIIQSFTLKTPTINLECRSLLHVKEYLNIWSLAVGVTLDEHKIIITAKDSANPDTIVQVTT